MKEMQITTVIPTRRRPTMLRQAIFSALGQTWPHLRVCVYDNASGDDTEAVVAKIAEADSRVRYHCHSENIGAYENFSFGVREVKTPFFSLLADDDVLLPSFYEQAMGAFSEHPDAMYVAMPTLEVDEEGNVHGGSGKYMPTECKYFHAGEGYYGLWDGSVPANWTGFVFRREVVEGIGFVNVSAGPAADVAFIRHALARYPGVVVPYQAGLLRVHPNSFSTRSSSINKINKTYWVSQAEGIENDAQISNSIRTSVRSQIENMYVTGYTRSALSSLIDDRTDTAIEITKRLREIGYGKTAIKLYLLVMCYRFIPLMSCAINKAGLRRRERQKLRLTENNRLFESRREEFKALLKQAEYVLAC